MTREELAHILRAAAQITDDPGILVIGSQSILGTYDEDELPDQAVASIEVDLAFFDDADERKADLVDGVIREGSLFHDSFRVYGQGVSTTTATLPEGWQDRVVLFDRADAAPSRALCLDPHDLVISKLAAGREKDRAFAQALVQADLISVATLRERARTLPSQHGRNVRAMIHGIERPLAQELPPGCEL